MASLAGNRYVVRPGQRGDNDQEIVEACYRQADAMLAEREKHIPATGEDFEVKGTVTLDDINREMAKRNKLRAAEVDAMKVDPDFEVKPAVVADIGVTGGLQREDEIEFIGNIHGLVRRHGIPGGAVSIVEWLDYELKALAAYRDMEKFPADHKEVDALKTEIRRLRESCDERCKIISDRNSEIAKLKQELVELEKKLQRVGRAKFEDLEKAAAASGLGFAILDVK